MSRNQFGLSRNIPLEVKKEIRQNSYFGCVICGVMIVEYEHVDPEFKDAKTHSPNCMTCLCPTCHSEVTKGLLSKSTVKKAMESPCGQNKGFVRKDKKPLGNIDEEYQVVFGSNIIVNCETVLAMDDQQLLSIRPDPESNCWLLNALFFDSNGKEILSIIDNEWKARTTQVLDIKTESNRFLINIENIGCVLEIESDPSNNLFIVKQLNMRHKNYTMTITNGLFKIFDENSGAECPISFANCMISNSKVGIKLNSANFN